MKKRTRHSLLAQSNHWDKARTDEDEWVEITDLEPILIPAELRLKLEEASEREGVSADEFATQLLDGAINR
jgi:hypothetical protein